MKKHSIVFLLLAINLFSSFGQSPVEKKIAEDKRIQDSIETAQPVLDSIESVQRKFDSIMFPEKLLCDECQWKIFCEKYFGAIQDCSKAIELNPNLSKAYYYRGEAKLMLSDYRGAIIDLTKYIKLEPDWARAYLLRGYAKYNIEDYSAAIIDFNKILYQFDPNAKEASVLKYSLNEAINEKDIVADAYYFRGKANINIGNKNTGCLDLSKAGEYGKKEAYDTIKKYCNKSIRKL